VSKSVGQLERELGVGLLERTTREVRLTPAGEALLDAGREVLTAADAAFARARTVGRGLEGTVRVGVSPAVGRLARDEAARALRHDAPGVSVAFLELRPGEMAQRLRERGRRRRPGPDGPGHAGGGERARCARRPPSCSSPPATGSPARRPRGWPTSTGSAC
jgi:DNA-binding transcriptional LysR family regulator